MPILVGSYNRFPNMAQYDVFIAELGPAAWWKLNDPLGAKVAYDSSGNGYTGTVYGGVTFGQTGPIVGAPLDTGASFAGGGHISNPSALPGPTGAGVFTFLAWALPAVGHYNLGGQVRATLYPANPFQFYYADNGGTGAPTGPLYLQVPTGSSTNDLLYLGIMPTAAWGMAAVTFDGTNFRGYVNGAFGSSVAVPAGYPSASALQALEVGDLYDFPGSIAEVAIFDYALSAAQVRRLWSPPVLFSGGSGFPQMVGQP